MCLGGGSSAPTWRPPPPKVVEEGPESPQDMVNNQPVENINDRSQQQNMRDANRAGTASGQKGGKIASGFNQTQTGSRSGRAY